MKPIYHTNGCECQYCAQKHHNSEQKLFFEIKKIYNDSVYEYRNKSIFGSRISFDIFIPSLKTIIEYQGTQHFKPIDYFGGEKEFKKRIKTDKIKNNLCKKNEYNIFYFTFNKNDIPNEYFGEIFSDINELLKKLKTLSEL